MRPALLPALYLLCALAYVPPARAQGPQAPTATNTGTQVAGAANVYLDEPPPSSYDRLRGPGQPALAPESLGLMRQAGRTLLALAGVLALVYLVVRLLLPKVVQKFVRTHGRALQVTERLPLDGGHALVRVTHEDGRAWLLGLSPAGPMVVLEALRPAGGPPFAAHLSPPSEDTAKETT